MWVVALLAYLVLLILVARLLSRRMTGLLDFFLAGRSLPEGAITLTFVASWFGAGSTLGSMNEAYTHGISALWLIAIPSVISCLLVGTLIAKNVRNLGCLSQPEAIERHYGPVGSLLLSLTILATVTTLIASQLVAAGHLLGMTMHLSPALSMALILGAVITYSVIGGFRAVVMTDILQFVLFTLAMGTLFVFVLLHPAPAAMAMPKLAAGFWDFRYHLGENLAMVATFVMAWSIAPEMWQRMSSSRTPQAAQRSALYAGGILLLLYVLVNATGLLAAMRIPMISEGARENVLITLALSLPWPELTALVLVGVLSAITSTIDSSLNVGCLTFTRDILQRYFWPGATQGHLIWASRLSTVLIGLPGALIALHYQSLIKVLWISADIYASTMFIPILGLFYAPRAGQWAGIAAMSLGALPVALNLLQDFHCLPPIPGWPGYPYTTLLGVGCSLVGFLLGAMFLPGPPTLQATEAKASQPVAPSL